MERASLWFINDLMRCEEYISQLCWKLAGSPSDSWCIGIWIGPRFTCNVPILLRRSIYRGLMFTCLWLSTRKMNIHDELVWLIYQNFFLPNTHSRDFNFILVQYWTEANNGSGWLKEEHFHRLVVRVAVFIGVFWGIGVYVFKEFWGHLGGREGEWVGDICGLVGEWMFGG